MKREFKHPKIDHTFIIVDPVYNLDGFPTFFNLIFLFPNTIKIDGISY